MHVIIGNRHVYIFYGHHEEQETCVQCTSTKMQTGNKKIKQGLVSSTSRTLNFKPGI